jgi:putative membrane protein
MLTIMAVLIFHLLGNSLALYLAARFIQGVSFVGDIVDLLVAGVILGIFNFFLKPILKIVSAPIILLTLGVFIFIINLFIIWLVQYILPELAIQGFWAYFWTIVFLTLINFLINRYRNE